MHHDPVEKSIPDTTSANRSYYRALFTLSQDGIFRVEYTPPINTRLPIAEQIVLARQNGRIVECNDALAQQFGFHTASELLTQMQATPPTPNSQADLVNQQFIQNGYSLHDIEVSRPDYQSERQTFSLSSVGIIENGFLIHTWNVQRDITAHKQAEDRLQQYATRLETQKKELSVAHQVAVAAANATDEDSLIAQITDIISRALYPDICGVLTVDEEMKVLRPHSSYRGIDEHIKHSLIPLTGGITGKVASTGLAWRVNDVTQEPNYIPIYDTIRSELAVPIKMGQRVIGLINIESVQSHAFTEADERLLSICAGQLATAIEQLRAKAKERQREAWLEKVLELGKAVTQITDWSTCVATIYDSIHHHLGFDRVAIFRYEPADHTIYGLLGTSRTGQVEDTSHFARPVAEDVTFQKVLADPKGFVFHDDLEAITNYPPDHEMVQVKNHATLAAWAGATPLAVIAVDNLISQRPMTEEQLEALRLFAGYAGLALENARLLQHVRQAEEKYRSIFENSLEGIFQTTAEGQFLHVNPAMARICGYDSAQQLLEQVSDIPFQLYHDPQRREEMLTILNTQEEVHQFEFQLRQKDGNLLWVAVNARAIRDEQGQVLYYEGTVEDINKRKQAEAERENLETQLRQAQKMEAIGRLTGGIAHDFNNLLTIILSASDLMIRHLPEEQDNNQRWLNHIKQAGEKAAALIRQLLAFSRQQVLELTIVNVNEVIHQIADLFKRLIGEDIELILYLAGDAGRIMADETQMEQILLNLGVNARDAMPQGGKLIIETQNVTLEQGYRYYESITPGDYVMLAVSDTGLGMDAATQARIFEPFFTTKEAGKGTGLGLATVHGIVRQFGGHITVYSEIGVGTTFNIYLPRVNPPAAATVQATPSAQSNQGNETILLLEDDETIRALAYEVLVMAGYHVLTSTSEQALELMAHYDAPVHLLLTDVVMPHMSGRELAERLTASRPQLKVLYMSGYADALIRHQGLLKPGLAYLQKPFTPEILTRKVRELLDRKSTAFT